MLGVVRLAGSTAKLTEELLDTPVEAKEVELELKDVTVEEVAREVVPRTDDGVVEAELEDAKLEAAALLRVVVGDNAELEELELVKELMSCEVVAETEVEAEVVPEELEVEDGVLELARLVKVVVAVDDGRLELVVPRLAGSIAKLTKEVLDVDAELE